VINTTAKTEGGLHLCPCPQLCSFAGRHVDPDGDPSLLIQTPQHHATTISCKAKKKREKEKEKEKERKI
jgi:hypothetical protein